MGYKEAGVAVCHKKQFKVATNSQPYQPVCDNLVKRDFTAHKPDQVYVADVSSIWTQEGWLYLAVVIDLFSRQGWVGMS